MNGFLKIFSPSAILLLAGACGPMVEDSPLLATLTSNIGQSQGAAEQARAQQTIDQLPGKSLLAMAVATGASGRFYLTATNGSKETWMNTVGQSIILRDGIIVGTRGFGDDMMGGLAPPLGRVVSDGVEHVRILEVLDGQDHILRWSFDCATESVGTQELQVSTTVLNVEGFKETCANEDYVFVNQYWQIASGEVVQSMELVSPGFGYLAVVRNQQQ